MSYYFFPIDMKEFYVLYTKICATVVLVKR